MPNTFGFGTDSTGFSNTVHTAIQKAVVDTLRAGLVAMPRGTVIPGVVIAQKGETFTIRLTEYPDLADAAVTSPLTEGVAPSPLKLGIDTQDFTVEQFGAWAKVTDLATIQSPHNLASVAQDKIARLAAQTFDAKARTAISTGASDLGSAAGPLSTWAINDAIAVLSGRDVQPVPGAGYYVLCHPYALLGLLSEDGLTGYRDVTAEAGKGLTAYAVGQYNGATFLVSTKFAATAGAYPVYVLGQGSLGAGDTSTLSFHRASGAAPGNELAQYESLGFKAIGGVVVVSNPKGADGAGTNDSDTVRAVKFTVQSGATSGLTMDA
jgi:N4-gp56 family major capsid protein